MANANNNSISRVTTYSGTDIEVIAYRNIRTPAQDFKISALQLEIKEMQDEGLRLQRELTAEQNRINKAPTSTLGEAITSAGSFLSSRTDATGKAQNRQDLNSVASDRLYSLKLDVERNNLQLEQIKTELNDIASLDYIKLGSIHTISYSSFREEFAVRSLGKVQAKTYTKGPRTVAGTMVFNVLQEHELYKLADSYKPEHEQGTHPQSLMLDQIRPFDVLLLFANEFGAYSCLHLFQLSIASEGQSMSVDEVVTRNTMNFYANDMLPMTSLGNAFENYDEMINGAVGKAANGAGSSSSSSNYKDGSRFDIQVANPFASANDTISTMLAESRRLF